ILTQLTEHGILKSSQGRYGGFMLAKSSERIKLIEIVEAMESVEKYFGCVLGFEKCSDENPCSLHTKWAPIRNELKSLLIETTIKDVISDPSIVRF
ncbi:MAG: Rrf2 family transcriptional regulator, partial [Marinilabiliales bacterium]